jgi:hypothetical protein
MITSVADFVRYFAGSRRRTWAVVDRVTPELLEWAPAPTEWTHPSRPRRPGPDAALDAPRRDLEGGTVKAWRLPIAMVEHEVHHRSQFDAYLAAAGTEPPPLYGYRMEDVLARVAREPAPAGGGDR